MLRAGETQPGQQSQGTAVSLGAIRPCEISPAAGEDADCFHKDHFGRSSACWWVIPVAFSNKKFRSCTVEC